MYLPILYTDTLDRFQWCILHTAFYRQGLDDNTVRSCCQARSVLSSSATPTCILVINFLLQNFVLENFVTGLISVLLLWPQNRGGLESQSTASDQEVEKKEKLAPSAQQRKETANQRTNILGLLLNVIHSVQVIIVKSYFVTNTKAPTPPAWCNSDILEILFLLRDKNRWPLPLPSRNRKGTERSPISVNLKFCDFFYLALHLGGILFWAPVVIQINI